MATSTTTTTTEEAGVSGRGGGGPRRRGFSSAVADEAGLTFDEQCMAEAEAEAEDVERRRRRQEEEEGANDPYLAELLFSNGLDIDELTALASLRTTPLSLKNMYRYASSDVSNGQRLRNAQFLHRELPIRIAQRTVDLLTLPHGLNRTRQVRSVAGIYLKYLRRFRECPAPTDDAEEESFTNMLHEMMLDRTSIPAHIARGIAELRDSRKEDLDLRRLNEMEDALYRFFTARVGLRFLAEHHVLSSSERGDDNDELRRRQSCLDYNDNIGWDNSSSVDDPQQQIDPYLGCIQKNCDPVLQARRVAAQVTRHCRECYGVSPDVEIVDCTSAADADVDFTYVPHHLQYMLAELLKNSCRATVRRHLNGEVTQEDHTSLHHTILDRPVESFNNIFSATGGRRPSASSEGSGEGITAGPSLPPIRVIIVKGAEDVTIKVADRAGGLPRTALRKIWSFAHTTNGVGFSSTSNYADRFDDRLGEEAADSRFEVDEFTGGSDVRGFGLPLARIYARYFGGELTVKSMEGHGVDAYLYLPVLGSACENLPDSVRASPGNMDSTPDHHEERGVAGDAGTEKKDGTSGANGDVNGNEDERVDYDGAMNRHDDFWTPESGGSGRGDGITHAGAMDLLARRALSR